MVKPVSSKNASRYPLYGYFAMLVIGILLAVTFMTIFDKSKSGVLQENGTILSSQSAIQTPTQLSYSGEKPSGDYSYGIVEKTVPVLAVNSENNTGVVENLTVKLIPGNGNILIDTNPFTETDLQYSTNVAAMVAKNITGVNMSNTDIVYSYKTSDDVIVVGGGSAGAAETIATIAALDGKSIRSDVAITGVINTDGTIGPVAGIPEKMKAAAQAGYTLLLVPTGQSIVHTYEPIIFSQKRGRYLIYREEYIVSTINITQAANTLGMDVQEVGNIHDVIKYMLQ